MFRRLCKLVKDTRGVAAIEFAFILPLMLVIPFGMYQAAQFVRVDMQLANATASMADLVAQQSAGVTSGKNSVLSNFCNAGQLMITPPSGANTSQTTALSAAILSVTHYSSGGVMIDWQSVQSCPIAAAPLQLPDVTKLLVKDKVNLVPNAGSPGDSVIIVSATYQYRTFLQDLVPPLILTETAFARPRNNATIACTATVLPCL
jgi:Flp pilus assembly protein TadG